MKSVILVLDPKIIFQNFTPNNCNNETNFSIFDISVLNVLKLTLKSLEAKQFTFQKTLSYCHWKQFHSVKMCENLQNPNDKIIILEVLILSLTIIIIALACDSVISSKFCLKPTNRGGQLHLIYISGDILTAARHPASLCITPPAPLITEADPPPALLSTGADPPPALLITRADPENFTIQQRGCQHICFNFNPKPEFLISA